MSRNHDLLDKFQTKKKKKILFTAICCFAYFMCLYYVVILATRATILALRPLTLLKRNFKRMMMMMK